jgi:hypothetical protein
MGREPEAPEASPEAGRPLCCRSTRRTILSVIQTRSREDTFDIRVEQAFTKHTLTDHSCRPEENNFHLIASCSHECRYQSEWRIIDHLRGLPLIDRKLRLHAVIPKCSNAC